MFNRQKNEIQAAARKLKASQLRRHRAKLFISARTKSFVRNPVTLLLPFTAGMLTSAHHLVRSPDESTPLPVPSLSKINHVLTFYITVKKLVSMNKARLLRTKSKKETLSASEEGTPKI